VLIPCRPSCPEDLAYDGVDEIPSSVCSWSPRGAPGTTVGRSWGCRRCCCCCAYLSALLEAVAAVDVTARCGLERHDVERWFIDFVRTR